MVVISRTKETYILEGFFFRDRVEMKNLYFMLKKILCSIYYFPNFKKKLKKFK